MRDDAMDLTPEATTAKDSKSSSVPEVRLPKAKVLYCFSGAARRCDVAHFIAEEAAHRNLNLEVVELDLLRGGLNHDLSNDTVVEAILARIKSNEFISLMAAPPCNTHSRARFSNTPGPRPLRTKEHPHGLPGLSRKQMEKVREADKLISTTIVLANAAFEAGIPYIITRRTWA